MPRHAKGPRLYLDRLRQQWVIRDGLRYCRTGCPSGDRDGAEKALVRYLGAKHAPAPSAEPLIADVLLAYAKERLPKTRAAKNNAYAVGSLARWWGSKRLPDVTARQCELYAHEQRSPTTARRDLQLLQAALRWWHARHHPIIVPKVVLPDKSPRRERYLTKEEAARMVRAAYDLKIQHVLRFLLLGCRTGSRASVLWQLTWAQVNLERGIMYRRRPGEAESATKRSPPARLVPSILFWLKRWRAADGPVVPWVCHYHGQPIKMASTAWRTVRARAGLGDDVVPHTLRHSRATWMAQEGVPIRQAADHLGMTVAILERHYYHQHPDWQKEAADV